MNWRRIDPEEARRSRQLRLVEASTHVPRLWVCAARWEVDESGATEEFYDSLFRSEELAPHWRPIIKEAIRHHARTLSSRRGARYEIRWGLRKILGTLWAKGGWIPHVTARQLIDKRVAIARKARALAQELAKYPFDPLTADLLKAADIDIRLTPESGLFELMRPAEDSLRRVADNLETGIALDRIGRDRTILEQRPYTGQLPQRRQLERMLQTELTALTGTDAWDSFIAAAERALDIDPSSCSHDVANRRTSRPAP